MADTEDLRRLEDKVDKLTDAVMRLIVIEERQTAQATRIGALESRVAANEASIQTTDKLLHKWINRGVGVWAVAVALFAAAELGAKLLGR